MYTRSRRTAYQLRLRLCGGDEKGDWTRAHALVDELESPDGMAVHAYLHRKEGNASNADYWYQRAGRGYYRPELQEEWKALVEGLTAARP